MKLENLYTVYDKTALTYSPPFTAANDATAKRSFKEMIKNHPYKTDMELYYIGQFHPGEGTIEPQEKTLIKTEEEDA